MSVVATGIDQALIAEGVDLSSTEQRISEVAERLRAEARARVAQTQAVPTFRAAPQPEPVRAVEAAPAPMPAPAYAAMPNVMEPAPQPVVRDDVVLTPTQPKQAMVYETPAMPEPQYEEPIAQGAFIPPQAERAMRPARMPRIDELPMPAQNQIRASRGEPAPDPKPMSLLQRLATVGFRTEGRGPSGACSATPARGSAPADVARPRGIYQTPRPTAGLSSSPGAARPTGQNGAGAPQRGRRPAGDSGVPPPPGQLSRRRRNDTQAPSQTRPGAFS